MAELLSESASNLMDQAEGCNREANDNYRNGRMEDAVAKYSEAINLLLDPDGPEQNQALSKYYSNRAQARIQLQEHGRALEDCTKALQADAGNGKARVRRGLCHEALGFPLRAAADLRAAVEGGEGGGGRLPPGLASLALTVKARCERNAAAEARRLKAEGVPRDLVHRDQALRLTLQEPLPTTMVVGEFINVNIRAANEFGLWMRGDFEGTDPVPLNLILLDLATHQEGDALPLSIEVLTKEAAAIHNDGKGVFQMRLIPRNQSDALFDFSSFHQLCVIFEVSETVSLRRTFLPVTSLPIKVVSETSGKDGDEICENGLYAADENDLSQTLGCHSCRVQYIPGINHRILVAESPGHLGIGGKVWDAGLVLLKYLADNRSLVQGRAVLELGSGTGWVGLAAAALGARRAALSDLPEICPLIDLNIKINMPARAEDASVFAVPISWGVPIDFTNFTIPEVIVLSDVVYDPELYNPLISTLREVSTAETKIYMTHRHRNPEDGRFFEEVQKYFELVQAELSESQSSVSPDVKLFFLTKLENASV